MVSPEFQITTKVVYVPAESRPEKNYHFFAYKIQITNVGNAPAQLMSRHWTIIDSAGGKEEVRGPGVVGVQPKIQPGQTFEYESACPLNASSGSMKGNINLSLKAAKALPWMFLSFILWLRQPFTK